MRDINSLAKAITDKAKQCGLDDNLFFVMTYSDYNKKRKHIKELSVLIDSQGVVINGKANPLLQDFDKATQSAAALAEKLMAMLGEKPIKSRKQEVEEELQEDSKSKKMPDFELCSPQQLKRWCKEFDIDPNDYSKQYLVKALTKRWKFKYED